MNIFGIVALVAFALCAGSALWEKRRERVGYEARIKGLNENILSLSDRMHGIEAERDALREQVQAYGKDAFTQAKRVDSALRERDEAIHMFNTLQTKLDGMAIAIRDQAQRNASVVAERDGLCVQLNEAQGRLFTVTEQRNQLQALLNDALVVKKSRSRTKPPTTQE